MGTNSPSRYRREGRKAFYPCGDPVMVCAYHGQYSRRPWLEGWAEAAKDHANQPVKQMGILETLREDYTDDQINNMPTVELIAAIEGIIEARDNA